MRRIGKKMKQQLTNSDRNLADWQIEKTRLVRQRYEVTRMVTNPAWYGFTEEDADQLRDRIIGMENEQSIENCQRNLPKYTNYKIQEIKEALNSTTCKGTKQQQRMRKRRETSMINQDGSVTRIIACFPRGSPTRSGNLRLCTECHAITRLPENV